MSIYIKLLCSIAFIFLQGITFLALFNYDLKDSLRKPYLAFCFGTGSISLSMFLLSLIGIKMDLKLNILIYLATLALLLIRISLKGFKRNTWSLFKITQNRKRKKINLTKTIAITLLVILITIQLSYLLEQTLLSPDFGWDSKARWGLKAKILYDQKNIYIDYFKNPHYTNSHPYYPLLVPLQMTNIYLFLGEDDDRIVKFLFFLYFLMLILALFDYIRFLSSTLFALIFTAFMVTMPNFLNYASVAYADVPLAFYCLISVLLFLSSIKKPNINKVILLSFSLTFMAFTKLEGFYYSIIMIVSSSLSFIIVNKNKQKLSFWRNKTLLLAIFLILLSPWLFFKNNYITLKHANFPKIITIGYLTSKLHRLSFIVPAIIHELFKFHKWHITPLLGLLSLFLFLKEKVFSKNNLFLLLTIIGYIGFYLASYTLSAWWGNTTDDKCRGLISVTLYRLLLPLVPIILLFCASVITITLKKR